ncbi:MAG: DUF1624 domain-containing protein [candidate division Zixibacteria bacterium]|nr:DUF1624 domain-containing protein [candidate division Zixibacteria bacterium]
MSLRRIEAIDISRGMAMLLVLLSHSCFALTAVRGQFPELYFPLRILSRPSTPAFLIISGMVVSYIYHSSDPEEFKRLRGKITKRAVVLLTIVHLLMSANLWAKTGDWSYLIRSLQITDIIGLGLITYIWVQDIVEVRYYQAIIMFLVSGILVRIWMPDDIIGSVVKQVFFGPSRNMETYVAGNTYTVVPLLAIYHCGVVLGKDFVRAVRSDKIEEFSKRLFYGGWGVIAAGAFVYIAGQKLLAVFQIRGWTSFFSGIRKYPPSIPYPLLYGGASCLMIAVLLWYGERYGNFGIFGRIFRVFGLASLVSFVVQHWIHFYLVSAVGLPMPLLGIRWFLFFFVTSFIVWCFAFLWFKFVLKREF